MLPGCCIINSRRKFNNCTASRHAVPVQGSSSLCLTNIPSDGYAVWLQYTYIRTVSSQHLLSTLLNQGQLQICNCPWLNQLKLVYGPFGQSKEGNKCTTSKEKLRAYCSILQTYYIVYVVVGAEYCIFRAGVLTDEGRNLDAQKCR